MDLFIRNLYLGFYHLLRSSGVIGYIIVRMKIYYLYLQKGFCAVNLKYESQLSAEEMKTFSQNIYFSQLNMQVLITINLLKMQGTLKIQTLVKILRQCRTRVVEQGIS